MKKQAEPNIKAYGAIHIYNNHMQKNEFPETLQ